MCAHSNRWECVFKSSTTAAGVVSTTAEGERDGGREAQTGNARYGLTEPGCDHENTD